MQNLDPLISLSYNFVTYTPENCCNFFYILTEMLHFLSFEVLRCLHCNTKLNVYSCLNSIYSKCLIHFFFFLLRIFFFFFFFFFFFIQIQMYIFLKLVFLFFLRY
ncbi:hypothetical protein GDO78_010013 [Eleutherodactylus coqui]|uniref:Uncharacterized protein n=1 Tax=Eleutherodactylus coqui TaxID=57060 RepID=A0A8J6FB70_ELECQ|nr:hypothetical protein GDO78_010013 [Eleutherodactylus coqui]